MRLMESEKVSAFSLVHMWKWIFTWPRTVFDQTEITDQFAMLFSAAFEWLYEFFEFFTLNECQAFSLIARCVNIANCLPKKTENICILVITSICVRCSVRKLTRFMSWNINGRPPKSELPINGRRRLQGDSWFIDTLDVQYRLNPNDFRMIDLRLFVHMAFQVVLVNSRNNILHVR